VIDSAESNIRLVARSVVDDQTRPAHTEQPDAAQALSRLVRRFTERDPPAPDRDRCSVRRWRAHGKPTPGWKGRAQWAQRIEARLDRHDQQLGEHARRLTATEQKCATLEDRVSDYAYELDMLTRMSLRSARRLDRLDRPASATDKE
jgi:hypothetical protein